MKQSALNKDSFIPNSWSETSVEEIDGAFVITCQRHHDGRGYFQEIFSSIRYDCNLPHVAQVNVSQSYKNVVRGLHVANFAKLCTVLSGRVFDVVADVRKGSATYGKWFGIWLDDKNCKQLFVPAGCAHGFMSCEDNTLFVYQQNGIYDPKLDWTIHWKDPILNIQWPESDSYVLSDKDQKAKEWEQ